ncbi:hypothetical protein N657DRAFT_657134 [Parathielavia appendiculata]|uniref:Uncharacterized protein n=1 Tax=Parathielavia appendiculata TaxID=2587402 RepID=A0AAN6TWY7_9PEZI|nr:hypothetical protein N657DRAFT_657134 [Parathielavia appendiculata]
MVDWAWGLCLCLTAIITVTAQQTGQHSDWPRWCGTVYQPRYPHFDPGGQTLPPTPAPGAPLLHVQSQPRYSLYLDSEQYDEFIVNAGMSKTPSVNTTGGLFRFPLTLLKPALSPIRVVIYGAPKNGTPTFFTVATTLLYLLYKPTGSVTRIDNLHGCLYFSSSLINPTFAPFFPYGFYASHDNFLRLNDTSVIDAYSALGFNAMTPLTTFDDSSYIVTYLSTSAQRRLLRFMYSLREGYKNLSYVRANILAAHDAPAGLFAYWSADEPDGWQEEPFLSPQQAYGTIRAVDPYRPVSCNATYGECVCDNCEGTVWDVTVVFNPQSFHGEGYWLGDPSVEESLIMVSLAVNDGAKGVISWVWPTSEVLAVAHGRSAGMLAGNEVVGFVVVDAAGWAVAGKMLVSVVNGGYVDIEGGVTVLVPNATIIESTPWGSVRWKLEAGKLSVPLLPALATNLVIMDLGG